MRKAIKNITFLSYLIIGPLTCAAQAHVTLASLLKEMADAASVARLPDPVFTLKQVSSYDRRSVAPGQPGWFANDDHTHFIRTDVTDGRKEYVMMDEQGPGVIVRFWETTFKRPGTVRIYFDNEKQARITIPGYDLMKFPYPPGRALLIPHSSYEPLQKGGSTLYLPLPFNKHCRVTWEDSQDKISEPRYYQINIRKYRPGTEVETFSRETFEANRQLMDQVNAELLNPPFGAGGNKKQVRSNLPKGRQLSLPLPSGPAALDFWEIKIDDVSRYSDQALRRLFVKADFDGKTTVYCPLTDFFGSGAGQGSVNSWYRAVIPGERMMCRWVMPYGKTGTISLVNRSDTTVNVTVSAGTRPWQWNSGSLYFHAATRQENNVAIKKSEPDGPQEWDLALIGGQGLFVGETLSVNNHMHKWYGEGDQKLWVDNESFPSEYGTGLEDYYNTSWAPVVLYQTPFANATRADQADSFGENTFTRTRNLDVAPFLSRFRFSLEMLGWDNGTADVTATTYWYGTKDTKPLIKDSRK